MTRLSLPEAYMQLWQTPLSRRLTSSLCLMRSTLVHLEPHNSLLQMIRCRHWENPTGHAVLFHSNSTTLCVAKPYTHVLLLPDNPYRKIDTVRPLLGEALDAREVLNGASRATRHLQRGPVPGACTNKQLSA